MARSRGTSKKEVHSARGDAAYYQAHKDDLDEWAAAEPGVRAAKTLDVVVSVRFSADEERMLRIESTRRKQTLSRFIREAALAQCLTGVQRASYLTLQTAAQTLSAFGGQIDFPGGTLRLIGHDSAAAAASPV